MHSTNLSSENKQSEYEDAFAVLSTSWQFLLQYHNCCILSSTCFCCNVLTVYIVINIFYCNILTDVQYHQQVFCCNLLTVFHKCLPIICQQLNFFIRGHILMGIWWPRNTWLRKISNKYKLGLASRKYILP